MATPTTDSEHRPPPDHRLYVPMAEGWKVHILKTWEKTYCFGKHPGEDFHHAILFGEIYLQQGTELYCLTCALRNGAITTDRLHWQHQSPRGGRSGLV